MAPIAGEVLRRYLGMRKEELERELALLYETRLLEMQARLHAPSAAGSTTPLVVIHPAPGGSRSPGEGESPAQLAAHGRQIARAMFEPVRAQVCEDLHASPEPFRDGPSAISRLLRHVTRVDPPDAMFLAAACWIWQRGIDVFCASEGPAP